MGKAKRENEVYVSSWTKEGGEGPETPQEKGSNFQNMKE